MGRKFDLHRSAPPHVLHRTRVRLRPMKRRSPAHLNFPPHANTSGRLHCPHHRAGEGQNQNRLQTLNLPSRAEQELFVTPSCNSALTDSSGHPELQVIMDTIELFPRRFTVGHMDGKKLYRSLGRKIDNQPTRAPWNETFYKILKELFSEKEADVFVKMPYGLSDLDRVARVTKYEASEIEKISKACAQKVSSRTYGSMVHITTRLRR